MTNPPKGTHGRFPERGVAVSIRTERHRYRIERKFPGPGSWILGITGLLFLCGILGTGKIWGGENPEEELTPRTVLQEAIQEANLQADPRLIWLKTQFVIRLSLMGDAERARQLMNQVFDDSKIEPDGLIHVPDYVAEAAKTAGMVLEFQKFTKDMVSLVHQRTEARINKHAGDEVATARIRFEEDIQLGRLYWQGGDSTGLKLTLAQINHRIQAARWEPGEEFALAAVLLARTGHDDEAMRVLQAYESAYPRSAVITKKSPYLHWMFRATYMAEVAQAQAEAGHVAQARNTLQSALDRVHSIPVSQLDEVFGNGTSLQSNAFKGIALAAASVGEASIAKKAQWAIADEAYRTSAVDFVIRALAKNEDMKGAEELVGREKCCWSGIALGLAEKGDWAGAIQADEAPRSFPKDRKFDGMMSNEQHRSYYFQKLAEARVHSQGSQRAMRWVREQKERDRISALLGLVDGLLDRKRIRAGAS